MPTRLTLDRGENLIVAETIQDVEPILEHNKMLGSIEQKSDWGKHIASIPNVFITKWLNEEWTRGNTSIKMFDKEFDALVARKLRDPDWKFLRVDGPSHRVGYGR